MFSRPSSGSVHERGARSFFSEFRRARAVHGVKRVAGLAVLAGLLASSQAQALPGFIAGKGESPRHNNATQVVLMKKGDATVVTIWADYEGPLDNFAVVFPVPADVKLRDVKTLKRDAVDHLDEITSPRFHEYWEMDACAPGEAKQEWQRDLSVKAGADSFLGAGMPDLGSTTKQAAELRLDVKAHFKQGEYKFSLVASPKKVASLLTRKGLRMPRGVKASLGQYAQQGMKFLVAQVNADKVELAGSRRALLSPIRFATKLPYTITSTLGQANSPGHQELVVYVLHPTERFEVNGFSNAYPPTNITVDTSIKERLGDFYAGMHDALLAKQPNTFLVEYAWPTDKHCGEPCPNEPMMIHELLTLGGDQFEKSVSRHDKNPKPPALTPEEEAMYKDADPDTRKQMKKQRHEVMSRRALLARNRYIITRLHHRYSADGLNSDVKVRPAGHVAGGIALPEGPEGEAAQVVGSAEESKYQVRFNAFHPNKKTEECDKPVPHRWGLAPRSYRGLRKTWTARDLAFKKRSRFELSAVVKSAVPTLGISSTSIVPEVVVAAVVADDNDSGCSIGAMTSGRQRGLPAWAGLFLPLLWLSRKSFKRRSK